MTQERQAPDQIAAIPDKAKSPWNKHHQTYRSLRRSEAGRYRSSYSGGAPTRSPDGEWMVRTEVDMPDDMLAAIEERVGGMGTGQISQLIREALVAYGVGDPSHVPGICDGTHSDDAEREEAALASRAFSDRLWANVEAEQSRKRK